MINAFKLERGLATKYEAQIGEAMSKAAKSERHARRLTHTPYTGRSTAERHRAADEISAKVLEAIKKSGEPVTRAEILTAVSDESESSVRYAVEKLTRECKINAQRLPTDLRRVKFSPKEEEEL